MKNDYNKNRTLLKGTRSNRLGRKGHAAVQPLRLAAVPGKLFADIRADLGHSIRMV